ncbi:MULTISPECIES: oligopeptide:H+ symporter [Cysteiniphilum]|uniref:MFS transporter n=1 Tax=Cysteiniphilum litorale TaxID=2056700 RepID=A0A8J2Z644_9GAMM|nr:MULTISPECIES: oligopeptide:H+ symporter [Cysteiniphilum]WHN66117.1 oligopeptide:H+ symporter [Cysteiniphilum sp. QT6929]GGG04441.1 MFS transporter [Cysteiniphilum litorale]
MSNEVIASRGLPKPFWVIWGIELWERFGYYATQAILALYFVSHLGFSQELSIYTFGSFSAFVYGFVWVGGYVGDKYLGAKRTVALGAIILLISYVALAMSTKGTIFYALGGIIVGNALFKANPSSLISKLYEKGDPALDGAMTLYYMAINLGSFVSMLIAPVAAQAFGWEAAFWISAFGLLLGLLNYFVFYKVLGSLSTEAGAKPMIFGRLITIIVASIVAVIVFGKLLPHTEICYTIVYIVVAGGFLYFLKTALSLKGSDRIRMLIAFLLILEGIVFFVLYNQMPTSLTFFAVHNIDNNLFGWTIPAASYQVLNPLVIIIASPILAVIYRKLPGTHVTKFCFGMTLCGLAFLVLYLPRFTAAETGLASPWWMVLTYTLQSTGELLVSGLGVAMVAELCPRAMSGFVMGIWFLTSMLAGPLGAFVGNMTSPPSGVTLSTLESLHVYTGVFAQIGIVTLIIAAIMWLSRPILNKYIHDKKEITSDHQINEVIN